MNANIWKNNRNLFGDMLECEKMCLEIRIYDGIGFSNEEETDDCVRCFEKRLYNCKWNSRDGHFSDVYWFAIAKVECNTGYAVYDT